jgi:membrane-bound ClpP family serine protease
MLLFHQPFFKDIPNAVIEAYQIDWKTRFFALLASPVVSSLLMMGILVGFYMEFTTPGFGIAGTVAVTCLILVMLSSFALEIANWLEVILLFVGLGILLFDAFVLPTFGLFGVIGMLFFFAGLIGMMVPGLESFSFEFDTNTFNAAGIAVIERLGWLSASIVLSVIVMLLLGRYFSPRLAAYSKLVLTGNEQTGYIAGDDPALLPPAGSKGTAATTLRPAGKIMINGCQYDAVSSGGFIGKDANIAVLRLDGSVIIVREIDESEKGEM